MCFGFLLKNEPQITFFSSNKNRIKQLIFNPQGYFLMETSVIEILSNKKFQLAIGDNKLPGVIGRLLSSSVEDSLIEKRLNEVPSETTIEERRFLYNFFKYLWFGKADVLEIGPFLGGTSRAIALGMRANPMYDEKKHLLHTYDQFAPYYTGEEYSNFLAPLFDAGALPSSLRNEFKANPNQKRPFLDIFTLIHKDQDYYPLLRVVNSGLPDLPERVTQIENIFTVAEDMKFECVFVDGCKSWYGTKAFFLEMAHAMEVGAYVIFQDYGWYSCFWIPAFVEIFKDHFDQIAMVDNTYVFRMKKVITKKDILNRFPDAPAQLGSEVLRHIFNSIVHVASLRGDTRQVIFGKMQLAAALAYTGVVHEAKSILHQLSLEPYASHYYGAIDAAKKSPTYTPEGSIFLD